MIAWLGDGVIGCNFILINLIKNNAKFVESWSEIDPKTPLRRGLGGPNSLKLDKRGAKQSQEGKRGSQDGHEETQRHTSCPQEMQSVQNWCQIGPNLVQKQSNKLVKKRVWNLEEMFKDTSLEILDFWMNSMCCARTAALQVGKEKRKWMQEGVPCRI